MDALLKIKKAGFDVTLVDGFIEISPASRLTEQQLTFLKLHKLEIISELQKQQPLNDEAIQFIKCGDCLSFRAHNKHGKGAGLCLAGVQPSGSCWWADSPHQCTRFDAKVEWVFFDERKPDALLIKCYTPNGDVIEVEARDEAHGEWLQRMNPRRECSDGLMPLKTFLASAVDKIETMFELNKTQT